MKQVLVYTAVYAAGFVSCFLWFFLDYLTREWREERRKNKKIRELMEEKPWEHERETSKRITQVNSTGS